MFAALWAGSERVGRSEVAGEQLRDVMASGAWRVGSKLAT